MLKVHELSSGNVSLIKSFCYKSSNITVTFFFKTTQRNHPSTHIQRLVNEAKADSKNVTGAAYKTKKE